jgi:CubicO group peptidase (beta-lactamase class C family)
MRHYRVPGLTLAIIDHGEIVFAKSYGVKDNQSQEAINNNTIFQAASVSKPITAIGALSLVDRGLLHLDSDINVFLKSWKLPDSTFTIDEKVTLRRILSHTAGLSVGGFLGYRTDERVPTAIDVLAGLGNSSPVVVDAVPKSRTRYSGGGYVIAQVMMEDVSGQPFAAFMKRNILAPLAMENSSYAQPLPLALKKKAALGHFADGAMVPGGYYIYPELGPAGLWTTAEDLAKVIIAIQKSYLGMKNTMPLSQATVKEMLTRQGERFGLGPKIETKDKHLIFEHNGSNVGYKASWMGFLDQKDTGILHSGGIVALTNGDNGFHLIEEIVSAIGENMAWQFLVKEKKEMPFKPLTEKERAMAGIFDKNGEEIFITENDGILNFWGHEIYKVNDFNFVSGTGHHNSFKLSDDLNTIEVDVTFGKQKEFLVLKRKQTR